MRRICRSIHCKGRRLIWRRRWHRKGLRFVNFRHRWLGWSRIIKRLLLGQRVMLLRCRMRLRGIGECMRLNIVKLSESIKMNLIDRRKSLKRELTPSELSTKE